MARPLRDDAQGRSGEISRYREHPPPPELTDLVDCTWDGTTGWSRRLRVLPDGCADLVWSAGRLWLVPATATAVRYPVIDSPNAGLRLRPGAAKFLGGWPAHELPVTGVPLGELLGAAAVDAWEVSLAQADGPARRAAILGRLVTQRREDGHTTDAIVDAAAAALDDPRARVGDVAAQVSVSPRELRRRFAEHLGYGPKQYQRVARLQRFLSGTDDDSLARRAADAGYADQAHLNREALAITGSTPARLLGPRELSRNVQSR